MPEGIVFDIKEFALHDGPGIRVTVFFKGCPLRCRWCHNPEGLEPHPQLIRQLQRCRHCGACMAPCTHEDCAPHGVCLHACPDGLVRICGQKMTPEAVAKRVHANLPFFADGGGVTFSGGEPLMQPEFLFACMEAVADVHIAVETSACAPEEVFREAARRAQLMMVDLKCMDAERHKQLCGRDNGLILKNIRYLMETGRPFIARVPVIPGMNDDAENLIATAEFLKGANVTLELLPYNTMTGAKYSMIGQEYRPAFDQAAQPNADLTPFRERGIRCRVLKAQ